MRYERMLDIDRRIREGEYPSIDNLAVFWELSDRTIKRDISYMRDRLQAPIEYDARKKGYYYTEPSWSLPAVVLKEGDIFPLILAHHALAQYRNLPATNKLEQVYHKLTQSLGDAIIIDPDDLLDKFTFVAPPSIPINPEVWEKVSKSVLQCSTAEIYYRSKSGCEPKGHLIDPYHMANINGDWYVFAYSHRFKRLLQFAVGRIERIEVTNNPFRRSSDFDPCKLLDNSFGGFASDEDLKEVRIRISKDWALEVDRKWHAKQKICILRNGDVEISFPVSASGRRPYFNVLRWVLGMGQYAKVIKPLQLKKLVAEEVKAMSDRVN